MDRHVAWGLWPMEDQVDQMERTRDVALQHLPCIGCKKTSTDTAILYHCPMFSHLLLAELYETIVS